MRPASVTLTFPIASLLCLLVSCDAAHTEAANLPDTPPVAPPSATVASAAQSAASAPVVEPAPPPPPVGPAVVESLPVPGSLPASIVRSGDGSTPYIVFLPGVCSNAGAYLYGFTETARALGGALAIDGDRPCGSSRDFHTITSDPDHEQPRIEAALRAAQGEGGKTPKRGIVLIGYSLGATLAERLIERFPERYKQAVLIGSPKDPKVARVKTARAVATMSCSLDVPQRMRGAVPRLEAAGVAAKYFEMPGCTHGNLTEGDRVFGEVFAWLDGVGR